MGTGLENGPTSRRKRPLMERTMTMQQQLGFAFRIHAAITMRKVNRLLLIKQRHKARACA